MSEANVSSHASIGLAERGMHHEVVQRNEGEMNMRISVVHMCPGYDKESAIAQATTLVEHRGNEAVVALTSAIRNKTRNAGDAA